MKTAFLHLLDFSKAPEGPEDPEGIFVHTSPESFEIQKSDFVFSAFSPKIRMGSKHEIEI